MSQGRYVFLEELHRCPSILFRDIGQKRSTNSEKQTTTCIGDLTVYNRAERFSLARDGCVRECSFGPKRLLPKPNPIFRFFYEKPVQQERQDGEISALQRKNI
ncbi:hypothetical protein MPNT_50106 [Candidatus Methylacidithermus pantelleriae]|uniref:Uncharacterized protein n=1 Tax=Candidatus Methylacidithermus pantelleriae TaxID=2744239 RepID=A0A8J2BKG3_9BACT|nr:hypothetical protein MPNT_50106 [Candidatus Methylacidithermus pantelleriae]